MPETPLMELAIFQDYLHDQLDGIIPQSQTVVDFLLTELLTTQINNGLRHQRWLYGLTIPHINTALAAASVHLEQDFRIGSPELEAWSLLHFRYVRVDLALEWAQIEAITLHHERTLRRRIKHGLLRLAYLLISSELAFRQNGNGQHIQEE